MAKDPKKTIKEINEELGYLDDQLISISNTLSNTVKKAMDSLKGETEEVADVFKNKLKKSISDIVKDSDKILDLTVQLTQGAAKLSDIQKTRNNLELKELSVKRNLQILENLNLLTADERVKKESELKDAIEKQTKILAEQEKIALKIQKNMGLTGKIMTGISKIPILGNLINSQKILSKVQKEAAKDESTRTSVFKTGLKAVGSSIKENLADPAVRVGGAFTLLVKIAKFFIDAMFGADKKITDIAKNFSISKEAAAGIYQNLTKSKDSLDTIYKTTGNIVEAFNDLTRLSDFVSFATTKQVESQIVLTKQLGLTNEEALDTQRLFAINNLEADKGVDITYNQIAAFYKQNKLLVDGRKVLTEVGKLSKLIQINFKGNYKELVNTVLEAKKLGFSLDQVSRIGESLLNFEQSISSEIEAELVTGRELNLEEARRYALNNDLLGLTKEIGRQGITYERFTRMNRIQQESIAKSLGLQANELADSLYKTKVIDKVAKGTTDDLRKRADMAEKANNLDEAFRLRRLASSIEQGVVDGKSLEASQKQASIQEQFEISLERVKQLFSDLVTGQTLDKLVNYFERIVVSLEKGKSLASILFFGPASSEELKASKPGESLDETRARLAYNKVNKIKSGAASYGAVKAVPQTELALGGIARKPVRALIGEAGPEAVVPLDKFYAKMDELITEVKKGGNVYLDANKVGTAMTVGTYKIS
jgi:hypothetical protein